jgi:hypothetical protein
MMAYLAMMAIRLIELHRVLKPTGTLYSHCCSTASQFGIQNHSAADGDLVKMPYRPHASSDC